MVFFPTQVSFFRWVLTRHPAARRAAIKCHDVGKNDEMVVNMHVRKIFCRGSLEECNLVSYSWWRSDLNQSNHRYFLNGLPLFMPCVRVDSVELRAVQKPKLADSWTIHGNRWFLLDYWYPLVNCHITMERSTIFKSGKSTISMGHLYHSYVTHYQAG